MAERRNETAEQIESEARRTNCVGARREVEPDPCALKEHRDSNIRRLEIETKRHRDLINQRKEFSNFWSVEAKIEFRENFPGDPSLFQQIFLDVLQNYHDAITKTQRQITQLKEHITHADKLVKQREK